MNSSNSSSNKLIDLVGALLKIVTDEDEEIVGELFSFDAGFVALAQEPSPGVDHGRFSFKIVNTSIVKSVFILKRPTESKVVERLGDVSLCSTADLIERAKENEKKNLDAAVRAASQINTNAPAFAQQIFNSISKTLPCRWNGVNILVLEEINIPPPYDKCYGKEGEALYRAQITLDGERSKLKASIG